MSQTSEEASTQFSELVKFGGVGLIPRADSRDDKAASTQDWVTAISSEAAVFQLIHLIRACVLSDYLDDVPELELDSLPQHKRTEILIRYFRYYDSTEVQREINKRFLLLDYKLKHDAAPDEEKHSMQAQAMHHQEEVLWLGNNLLNACGRHKGILPFFPMPNIKQMCFYGIAEALKDKDDANDGCNAHGNNDTSNNDNDDERLGCKKHQFSFGGITENVTHLQGEKAIEIGKAVVAAPWARRLCKIGQQFLDFLDTGELSANLSRLLAFHSKITVAKEVLDEIFDGECNCGEEH